MRGPRDLRGAYYDGWQTSIDGNDVPEKRADYAFTSVEVRAGRHLIDRRDFPPRLYAGLAATIGTSLALVWIDARMRRAENERPPEGGLS